MSHIQNLQRLRSSNKIIPNKQLIDYFNDNQRETMRAKLGNFASVRLNPISSRQAYNNFLDSNTIVVKKPQPKRLSGSSLSGKKQSGKYSPLSIYNLSVNHSRKQSLSIPLTDRRDYATLQIDELDEIKSSSEIVSKSMFTFEYVIGKGGFSKVWRVQMKKNNKIYAMKQMYKTKIINKKSIHSVMNERKLLAELDHPFLINMNYAFQDKENLYLVMEYLNGGDLRFHMIVRRFTEHQVKFFISCLLLSVWYLHNHRIIHRDIKPENLILQSNGYLRLTDLGISNKWKQNNSNETSGTPGYMAPEVLRHKNHSFTVDYFAIGILVYELMLDRRPYMGNRKQIREQVMVRQAVIKAEDIPKGWSTEAADFANKLMIRNPENRLGHRGAQQIRDHPWLKSVDWVKLMKKQVKAPYIPMNIEDNYEQYKQQISEDSILQSPEQDALLLRNKNTQKLFEGYQYPLSLSQAKVTKSTFHTNSSLVRVPSDCVHKLFRDGRKRQKI